MSRDVANRLIGLAAAVVVGAWCGAAAAQTPAMPAQMNMADHRGAVQGRVSNASGAPVASATVMAVNDDNGAQFTAVTDPQGAYAFGALPVGKYTVSIASAGVTAFRRRGVEVAADSSQPLDIRMDAATAAEAAEADRQELLQKIATLEQRISDLESSTVLSDPETRVRRVEVYVDENGGEQDEPIPGVEPTVTYQRERVFRRQTINEKIEEALAAADEQSVALGIDAATVTQGAGRTRGTLGESGNAYALASADLFFTAKLAQYTIFFADVVALSGSPPDAEIPTLTLLNGYTARLETQNALNLREVWLRTELFGQRLALTAGRLDLTNYFDANALANDESTQFLSDALVNNQMLGLASNGTGVAAEFDAKTGFRLKFGLQQSNNEASNLSDSMYTLSEVGYTFTPFALPEGSYRLWFRTDNTAPDQLRKGTGVSLDQKLTNSVGLFGRYGTQEVDGGDDRFYSAGVGFQNGLIFFPQDTWGIGWAHLDLASGEKEHLTEGYYNFQLTDRLRLSFNLTYVLDEPEADNKFGYLLPGIRFQAAF
ncbi:MAG: carboxypeptidase regulatory-like domain-containing protein [Vicinamibacterales bacterium]